MNNHMKKSNSFKCLVLNNQHRQPLLAKFKSNSAHLKDKLPFNKIKIIFLCKEILWPVQKKTKHKIKVIIIYFFIIILNRKIC